MRLSRFALLLLSVLVGAMPARAQDADADFWPGTHVFRHVFGARKITSLDGWDKLGLDPSKTLLVVLGRPNDRAGVDVLDRIPGGLREFVLAGGAVLIASDHHFTHPQLFGLCNRFVNGNKVSGQAAEMPRAGFQLVEDRVEGRFLYRKLSQCLIPEPMDPFQPPLFLDTPLLAGDRKQLRVATNQPSYLEGGFRVPGGAAVLARLPRGCFYPGYGHLRRGVMPFAFAVSVEAKKGRLLLLADHNVFSNEMILAGLRDKDNDNFRFAFNAVDWLRGQDGPRDRVLFVEDGYIETELRPPLVRSTTPLRDLLRGETIRADLILKEIQEEHKNTNHINRELIRGFNNGPGRAIFGQPSASNYFLLFVALAAIGLGLYGLNRVMHAAHRPDLSVPLFAAISGKHRPAGSTLAMRQQEALAEDDLREFAREAARVWFEELPGYADLEEKPPQIESRSGSLRREVMRFWKLAQGGDQPRMRQREFQQFLARLDELTASMGRGELRLTW